MTAEEHPIDEILAQEDRADRAEDEADQRELELLTGDRLANYAMIRGLVPVTSNQSVGAQAFMSIWGYFGFQKKILQFRQWQAVEGGVIQVRENPKSRTDMHGYAVIRPQTDLQYDHYLRVWNGQPNTVIIVPRMDTPLPRQGSQKDAIIEQMQLLSGAATLREYAIWLERMKSV